MTVAKEAPSSDSGFRALTTEARRMYEAALQKQRAGHGLTGRGLGPAHVDDPGPMSRLVDHAESQVQEWMDRIVRREERLVL